MYIYSGWKNVGIRNRTSDLWLDATKSSSSKADLGDWRRTKFSRDIWLLFSMQFRVAFGLYFSSFNSDKCIECGEV